MVWTNVAQGTRVNHTGWPPYGLPPNYTPPYEDHPEQEQPLPLITVNPSGIPTNQEELVNMQPNADPIGANVGSPIVLTGTQPVVQPRVL